MALLFEKRVGAPSGTITINTGNTTYVFSGSQVSVADNDVASLKDHPFVQLVGGTGGPYVPGPVYQSVSLKDGVLTGGDGLPASVNIARRLGGVRVVGIGDSITAAQGTSPGVAWHNGHLTWAMSLTGGALRYVNHWGISGQTAQQGLANSLPNVLAMKDKPHYCVIELGTNNMGDTDLTDAKAAILSCFSQLRLAGIEPIAFSVGPRNGITAAQRKNTAAWNAWLSRRCELDGIIFVDIHDAMADPSTGGYAVNADTIDGLHPSPTGYKKMGQALADALAPRLNQWTPYLRQDSNDGFDLLPGGLFLSQGPVPGLATSWEIGATNSVTFSLISDSSIKGNWQRIVSTSSNYNVLVINTAPGSAVTGRRYGWSGRLRLNNMASASSLQLYVQSQNAGGTFGTASDKNYITWLSTESSDIVFDLHFTAPATDATGGAVTAFQLALVTVGGSVDYQLAQQSIRDLTALGTES